MHLLLAETCAGGRSEKALGGLPEGQEHDEADLQILT